MAILLARVLARLRFLSLQFREQEKVTGEQIWGIRWLGRRYCVVFGQKFAHKQQCVSSGVIVAQKPIFVLPQILVLLADYLTQIAHNLQVIFLIDRSTLKM